MSHDTIIRDPAIFQNPNSVLMRADYALRIGQVKSSKIVKRDEIENVSYVVKVWKHGSYVDVPCIAAENFGGIYNYTEAVYRGFSASDDDEASSSKNMAVRAGDYVVVACLEGQIKHGVIISSLQHQGRKPQLSLEDGPQHYSIFNGVENYINKDGEFTQTFKGQPTNLDKLSDYPDGNPIEEPIYDEEVGSSYYKWDMTGSFTLSDNAKQDPITMKIDKPGGIFRLDVGQANLEIAKEAQAVTINNKVTTWKSEDEFSLDTKTTNIKSSDAINIESSTITSKGDIDSTGKMNVTGDTEITGNFKTSGMTELAGGANPLIYNILLTLGVGNLGAPVVSANLVLVTVLTKAT